VCLADAVELETPSVENLGQEIERGVLGAILGEEEMDVIETPRPGTPIECACGRATGASSGARRSGGASLLTLNTSSVITNVMDVI
jgi:hypothetical protein